MVLGSLKIYNTAAWSGPSQFRSLIAKPLDLIGKVSKYLNYSLPTGCTNIVNQAGAVKDLIGFCKIFKEPLPTKYEKSVACLTGVCKYSFTVWETADYLRKQKVIVLTGSLDRAFGWFGAIAGGLSAVGSLHGIKTSSWHTPIGKVPWANFALSSSALAKAVLYSPMVSSKAYKGAKLAVNVVNVIAGAALAYGKSR